LAAAGCEIEIHPVRSLTEAADAAPIVVNCAGLGAAELTAMTRCGRYSASTLS